MFRAGIELAFECPQRAVCGGVFRFFSKQKRALSRLGSSDSNSQHRAKTARFCAASVFKATDVLAHIRRFVNQLHRLTPLFSVRTASDFR